MGDGIYSQDTLLKLGKPYHGSTEKCDGLVSLLIIVLIHDCVRIMLLYGYSFSLFVVVVFKGRGVEKH